MRPLTYLFPLPLLLALLPGCGADSEPPSPEPGFVTLPVRIAIPFEGEIEGRAPADPGQPETWDFPAAGIIYLVCETPGETTISRISASFSPSRWVADTDAAYHRIYTYQDHIEARMPSDVTAARVYVALGNRDFEGRLSSYSAAPATEQEVKEITFHLKGFEKADGSVDEEARDKFLKNLYSSPCNLTREEESVYYGTVNDPSGRSPYLNIVCYHVGARLDLTWEVEAPVQPDVHLTFLSVTDALYTAECSLFNPTNRGNTALTDLTEITYLSSGAFPDGAGQQWYGRDERYIIQNVDRSPASLTFRLGKNWTDARVERKQPFAMGAASDIYTPWIRYLLTIKSDLSD